MNNSIEEGLEELAKICEAKKDKDKEPKHISRFDFMSPEEYQFWVEEHQ